MSTDKHPSAEQLESATKGFDYLFSNDLAGAKAHLGGKDDPFHLLGAGVVAFLEAALGMETGLMAEATRSLTLSEAGSRQQLKAPKSRTNQRFPAGMEFEILNADAVVLLGLTHALSETYMGYLQCMYSLNNAHSKFTKLYKTVFPQGLDSYKTPATTPAPSRKPSKSSLSISGSTQSVAEKSKPKPTTPTTSSFFSRLTGSISSASSSSSSLTVPGDRDTADLPSDGPVEELIVAGTAFGYGLFNLVFSLLPKKVQGLVGFLGYKHDRELALKALAVSAAKKDVHSVFAGLVLMTYNGVVLLLSGFQADEEHIIKQYKAIVDSIEPRYPDGALWVLNRAKILRMSSDPEGAIRALKEGLRPERPHSFAQADSLLIFELAWTLLGQMKYQESADMFLKMTELNSWSHATYYFLAAGCYVSLGNVAKAQELLDAIPGLIDKRKVGGKDLPTEVFIKKKMEFLKAKQKRRGGKEEYAQAIKISVAEELAVFWNTHARIERRLALAHIQDWTSLTPALTGPLAAVTVPMNPPATPSALLKTAYTTGPMETPFPRTPVTPSTQLSSTASSVGNPNNLPDLDTTDELALRSLLLGINHRTAGHFDASRVFLKDACAHQANIKISTWIGGVAMFELAVLELKVVDAKAKGLSVAGQIQIHEAAKMLNEWDRALKSAEKKLDAAGGLAGGGSVDLSSRLDSRIEMMRDEIKTKRAHLGI